MSYSDYFYIEDMTRCDISNWIRVNNNALAYCIRRSKSAA